MKKIIVLVLCILILLCSCNSVSKSSDTGEFPDFVKFGKEGEIVVTARGKYYLPRALCINRVSLVFDKEEIHGILKGVYTRTILNQIIKENDIVINGKSDFTYYYYSFGKTFFSTKDAKTEYGLRIKNGVQLIPTDIAYKMNASDLAVYSKKPQIGYKNLEIILLTVNGDYFDLEIKTSSIDASKSLMRLIRSDFNTFETKLGIDSDTIFKQIEDHFILTDEYVYISNLNAPEYLQSWVRRIFDGN